MSFSSFVQLLGLREEYGYDSDIEPGRLVETLVVPRLSFFPAVPGLGRVAARDAAPVPVGAYTVRARGSDHGLNPRLVLTTALRGRIVVVDYETDHAFYTIAPTNLI